MSVSPYYDYTVEELTAEVIKLEEKVDDISERLSDFISEIQLARETGQL